MQVLQKLILKINTLSMRDMLFSFLLFIIRFAFITVVILVNIRKQIRIS